MALTKISRSLLDTGVSDSSDATAITIDSSENIGINETSPFGRLHISDTQTGRTSADSTANTLVIEDDEGGMSILSSNSGAGYILFGDVADSAAGGLLYDHSADRFRFRTNAAWDRMILDSSGRLLISTTTEGRAGEGADMLTIGDTGNNSGMTMRSGTSGYGSIYFSDATSGTGEYSGYVQYAHNGDMMLLAAGSHTRIRIDSDGLKFGSDSAAANALDDYEEGTWTPAAGPGSSITYSYNSGNYTKVGRLVTAYFGFLLSGGTFTSSEATISGLPFAVQTTGSYQEPQFVIYTYGAGPTGITGAVGASNSLIPGQITFYLNGGESQGRGRKFTTNADAVLPGNEAFDSNTFVKGVVIYYTA
jgi:hypothetical protein